MQHSALRPENQQQRVAVIPENLNVLEYDTLDIIILSKFLRELSYTVNALHDELVEEGRVKDICIETIRRRLEEKFVVRRLVSRVKTCTVVYDLNDSAVIPIRNLIRRFVMVLGVTEIL